MMKLPEATLRIASDLSTAEKGRRAADRLGDSLGSRLLRDSMRPLDVQDAAGRPVDVHDLAASEDIDVVQSSVLRESGRIEWTGRGLRIVLREADGQQRQRFTLAHELGHHLIFGVAKGQERRYSLEEEKRCDRFAGALLMPKRAFSREFIALHGRSLATTARELADRFDVSLDSAIHRLADLQLMGSASILLVLQLYADGYYRVYLAAYDKSAYRRLEGMTPQDLWIERALRRPLPMPLESRDTFVRARLPTRQRGFPRNSPSILPVVAACTPLRPDSSQMLVELDLVVDPLQPRVQKPPLELQADLIGGPASNVDI